MIPMIGPKPNLVSKYDGFSISYNPVDVGTYGDVTTAIVYGRDEFFLVLNGNHRDQLNDAAKQDGLQGCLDYFNQHIDQANKYSEHHPATSIPTVEDLEKAKQDFTARLYAEIRK